MIWIFWVRWLSPMEHWLFSINVSIWLLSISTSLLTMEHYPLRNLQNETLQTTFDTFDQSQHVFHTLHRSFLCFSCVFAFLKIIKHDKPKMLLFSSIFNIKMATQKFTNLFSHADMTAVTIQSNKIVLNKLRTSNNY